MQLITTADGSHTLFAPQFNEIYHSRHGAIQESRHVFIAAGLNEVATLQPQGPIRIFEVGLGTGLNALLTMLWAEEMKRPVVYHSSERYPVPVEVIKSLNYTEQLGFEFCFGSYHSLHLVRWDEEHTIAPFFTFCKYQAALEALKLFESYYDLIYFDAFAPAHQPELWTPAIFQKMHEAMQPGGVLVTYCSKSAVQRAMREAGFEVEKIPGPPGKREMLRARKK